MQTKQGAVMQHSRWIKWLLVGVVAVMMTACGGSDGGVLTDQQKAVNLIVTYADDNTSTRPTADDYQKAGIDLNGVDADDFSDYLALLHTAGLTKEDIKKIAKDWGILIVDTDGDGTPDGIDADDDGDGVVDADDAFPLDATESVDTDEDGIGNNADTDDDGDGVVDADDAFPLDATESVDTDGDGIGNNADIDDDDDGVDDADDAFPLDATESVDTDEDGIGNNADTDDDGDGVPDSEEEAAGTDPLDPDSKPEKPFVFKVKTDNPGYVSVDDTQYKVYAMGAPDGTYSYDVDCDYNGTFDATGEGQTSSFLCDYDSAGTYTIAIRGTYPRLRFGKSSPQKLISIEQWGTQVWTDLQSAFNECKNMTVNATDKPNLGSVSDLSGMFSGAENFNGAIGDWNVSSVTLMENMFAGASVFDQDLGKWDVSSVTDMEQMFRYSYEFDGNISDWNTSAVTNMRGMFESTRKFNQDISRWDTSSVEDMQYLFAWSRKFDQNISKWNTKKVTHVNYMFIHAHAFNQDISQWDVSSVKNMNRMFNSAILFNQDIGDWNTSRVTDMSYMFYNAESFNQDLSGWNTKAGVSHDKFAIHSAGVVEPVWH